MEVASFGGGCFWCIEPVFQDLRGVHKVESGYMGGKTLNPTYRDVCSGMTGHAEIIQVTFDPSVITYRQLLEVFFTVHDPTTLNRQGNDVGTQYRSVIFYHSDAQQTEAEAARTAASGFWDDPIITEISPAQAWYKAEDYHQNYYKANPYQGYCQIVIAPKVRTFQERWKRLVRS